MLLLTALVSCCLTGCREDGGDSEPTGRQPVAVKFALSVAKHQAGSTRMPSGYTDGDVNNVDFLYLQSFIGIGDKVTANETYEGATTVNPLTRVKTVYTGNIVNAGFFTSSCDFAPNVNKLLVYGHDKRTGTYINKGALETTLTADAQPADIRFSLKPIMTREDYLGIDGETDNKTIAEELAGYLTSIANAETENNETWKDNAFDPSLQLLYKNFINELAEGVGDPLPGSAANVKVWGEQLKSNLDALTFNKGTAEQNETDDAIRTAIKTEIAKWNNEWNGFPASISLPGGAEVHLPDGAAVVRWDGVEFVPETQTTTVADINNITRFTYPAEIYYYGNSPTWVSSNDLSGNFSTFDKWNNDADGVLHDFTKSAVDATTKTVAMGDPLQYGVAQLQMKMSSISALPHAGTTPATISVGTNNFKLTGIIVGGQLPVGFDFTPESLYPSYSEADMKFIYDTQLVADNIYLTTTETSVINTLVLQSYTSKNVKIALEFENNSDTDFKGLNGTVFKGTKFYLVGEIDYTKFTENNEIPEDVKTRVFTQDRTTTITVTVNSLAKAYNVLPNLLSPRLEMGIELTPQWEKATPTDVIL